MTDEVEGGCLGLLLGCSLSGAMPLLSRRVVVFPPSHTYLGFPGGSVVKNPPANAGDAGLISGLGRSPGKWNVNLLFYSCLENPIDKGACWAAVHGVGKSQTWLSDYTAITNHTYLKRGWCVHDDVSLLVYRVSIPVWFMIKTPIHDQDTLFLIL